MTEDELRDKYLSDVGLDEQGGKAYDLGSQTVKARLQKNLSFLFELPNGKTAKSLPKKGADTEKYEAAKADFDEMRKAVKKIVKSRSGVLFADFLSGRERSAADWRVAYLQNPLLRAVAELIVWAQDGKTFTLGEGGSIDSAGNAYAIGEEPIKLAHPMELEPEEVTAWQKFLAHRGLKQPFPQVWEPVCRPESFRPDRYKGCRINPLYLKGQQKRGVAADWYEGYYGGSKYVAIKGFSVRAADAPKEPGDQRRYLEIAELRPEAWNRRANMVVAYLDRLTMFGRVRKDDASVMDLMDGFTLAQIMDFIQTAQEAQAVNVLALLLEYKNAHFADFDPMDEFTLESDI